MSPFEADYEPSPWEPIASEVERYERSNGSEPSELVGDEWIVLWTLGARSAKVRKTPLVRTADEEGCCAVIGSMGGAPTAPQWVHNVRANPIARLQDGEVLRDYGATRIGRRVAGEIVTAAPPHTAITWGGAAYRRTSYDVREAFAEEKAQWWERATRVWPAYDDYQAATTRVIPLFVLEPAER